MKPLFIAIILLLITSCAAPLGTITVHSVNKENRLNSPLVNSSELNSGNQKTIYKTESDGETDGDDVFSIYLTDSYLRYLKDLGGINEVLIVVKFTEAVSGTSTDSVTKILGPYNNVADASRAPLLNKALYGPKKMESDLLSMNIRVYEYDLEENDNNAAMLEFIAGSASTLALADPITLGEIKIAKEIAQTLVRTNENDLVLEMDLDFVAGNSKYKPYTRSKVLPLKDGDLVIVKQEACRLGTCYDYFGKWDSPGPTNVPGIFTDVVMALPTSIVKATTDVPDPRALDEFQPDSIVVTKKGLETTDKVPQTGFIDKTWLRLSIVKGGDPSQWEARKALYPQEEELNRFLRNPDGFTMENMLSFTQRMELVQQALLEAKANVKLTSIDSHNDTHFIKDGTPESKLCLDYDSRVELDDKQSQVIDIDSVKVEEISTGKGSMCFKLTRNSGANFNAGIGQFQALHKVNGKSKTTHFPIVVVVPVANGDFSDSCSQNTDGKYEITLTSTDEKARSVTSLAVGAESTGFTQNKGNIIVETDTKNPTINIVGVLGGKDSVSVSGCP